MLFKQEIKLLNCSRKLHVIVCVNNSSPVSDLYRLPVCECLCSSAQFGL